MQTWLLSGSESCKLEKQQTRRQTAEMRFHRAVTEYRMTDRNSDGEIRDELGIISDRTLIEHRKNNRPQHLETTLENRIRKLLCRGTGKPNGRRIRNIGEKDGRI
jgi:hypothetical protein